MGHSLPYIVLDKPVGETPLETLKRWKATHAEYKDVPAAYAGRLDPMASGKLLVLLGDECKKQDRYTGLDKEYEIEVVLDIGSDTGDVLGITSTSSIETHPTRAQLERVLRKEVGTYDHPYPAYSSKTVHGKPLFLHTLEGTLSEIDIPTHPETIYSISDVKVHTLTTSNLQKRVLDMLAVAPTSTEPSKLLGADFRITPVRESWNHVFAAERRYTVIRMRVICGTGTYMRSLAGRIGEGLGTQALALSIHRTRIGRYLALGPFGFFWKLY